MLYSVEHNFLPTEFSSSSGVLGDLVHRKELSVSLMRMTPNTVPTTFLTSTLQHYSQKRLCLPATFAGPRFPESGFLCFLSEEQGHLEKSAKQRFSLGTRTIECCRLWVFVKSEILAWSGSLMGVASSSAVIILSDSFGT